LVSGHDTSAQFSPETTPRAWPLQARRNQRLSWQIRQIASRRRPDAMDDASGTLSLERRLEKRLRVESPPLPLDTYVVSTR
jgi:hypothetical protein